MKHRIVPLAILLLASFLYDALGLFVAVSAMVAPPPINGPLEAMAIGQAPPNESPSPMVLPPIGFSPTAFPADPSLAPDLVIGPVPDLPLPSFLTSAAALTGDAVMAAGSAQTCHSVPLPDQPTGAYPAITSLERIIAHGTAELTGLDAIMASALVLDDTGAGFAQQGGAARLAGIIPEVVDPPG